MKTILQSIRIYIILTLLTGILYPLAMTGVAQLLFPKQGFLGELRVNSATGHAVKTLAIGQIAADGRVQVVWHAPKPVVTWPGVKQADQFGNSCIQSIAKERCAAGRNAARAVLLQGIGRVDLRCPSRWE